MTILTPSWKNRRTKDVKEYGAKGDGITDDTSAIMKANTKCQGSLYFPSGIYCISDELFLKTATEYYGPRGGSFIIGPEVPYLGLGACLKWIGSNNATVVNMYNNFRTIWDGIDIWGVDLANGITGLRMHSNNSPPTTKCAIKNTKFIWCDLGIVVGDMPGGEGQTEMSDQWFMENIYTHHCNTSIYINCWNSQFGWIRSSTFSHYDKGIHVRLGGPIRISNNGFANIKSPIGTDAHILLEWGAMGADIEMNQGEPWLPSTITPLVRLSGPGNVKPVNIKGMNWVDTGLIIDPGSYSWRVVSQGNFYNYVGIILNGTNSNNITSIGDTFNTGTSIEEDGDSVNNRIIEIDPYYVGGGTYTWSYRETYNRVVVRANRLGGIRSGAVSPIGSVAPDYFGEHYIDTTAKKEYVADGLTNADWFALN